MSIIYLRFNQNARLHSWLQQHSDLCRAVTGKDPVFCLAKPIAAIDLRHLPYTHANFTPSVQWWMDKHCPYDFVKTGEGKANWIIKIKDWYYYKIKKGS